MTSLDELILAFETSPLHTGKFSHYFEIYDELFSKYRNQQVTLIDVGVMHGGSLLMWKKWLGDKARIIGIDLNPAALEMEKYGFEIYIGDQGDKKFWDLTLPKIGQFDILIDDGGHKSIQQIQTLISAVDFLQKDAIILIEDTHASFLKGFSAHGVFSFHEYSKEATNLLAAKASKFFEGRFIDINKNLSKQFENIHKISFYTSAIGFDVRPKIKNRLPLEVINISSPPELERKDFRYDGINELVVDWPNLFTEIKINVKS